MASNTYKHHRPRSLKKLLVAILVLTLLSQLCLVSAQSSDDSPPPAQPGSDKSEPPTKTHGSDSGGHGSVTVSGSATITAAPSPSVYTTVSVINGTTTTLTMTITAAAPAPVVQTTSTIPKAAQSILVIQSTAYGKVLPAAGPVDDNIESHFWDQFSPQDIPGGKGSKSSSANSHQAQSALGWLFSVFGQSLVMIVCVVSLVVPAWILL
ncbi:hypothetical protein CPC16_001802 [Podila verticillata]|nr:hypothetical protein BGZ52_009650 [Haplosporangium bisporale]KAF9214405.1 hypothetical protein BGZ59_003760 [Podila verticillata]KAF9373533.1 hypothetical protein CPC16_001802 [Podila verticillata]KAI9232498.1 MAG: hypothetical protein BYD32DRAFT_428216 [Podila humilis]KFH68560.1 hypothetical protein MVEG_05372 [Podila verticillata NRRL 6337]